MTTVLTAVSQEEGDALMKEQVKETTVLAQKMMKS